MQLGMSQITRTRFDTSKEFTSLYHKYTATHLQQSNSQFLLEMVLTDGEMAP